MSPLPSTRGNGSSLDSPAVALGSLASREARRWLRSLSPCAALRERQHAATSLSCKTLVALYGVLACVIILSMYCVSTCSALASPSRPAASPSHQTSARRCAGGRALPSYLDRRKRDERRRSRQHRNHQHRESDGAASLCAARAGTLARGVGGGVLGEGTARRTHGQARGGGTGGGGAAAHVGSSALRLCSMKGSSTLVRCRRNTSSSLTRVDEPDPRRPAEV